MGSSLDGVLPEPTPRSRLQRLWRSHCGQVADPSKEGNAAESPSLEGWPKAGVGENGREHDLSNIPSTPDPRPSYDSAT